MHHVGVERARVSALSEGACDPTDTDALLERLVNYTAAGFVESLRAKTQTA